VEVVVDLWVPVLAAEEEAAIPKLPILLLLQGLQSLMLLVLEVELELAVHHMLLLQVVQLLGTVELVPLVEVVLVLLVLVELVELVLHLMVEQEFLLV
jgi:hypothetical protein